MFQGSYHGKQRHEPDLHAVLERGRAAGVEKIMVTAGTLDEAKESLEMVSKHDDLFTTVGIHPTRLSAFEDAPDGPESLVEALLKVAQEGVGLKKVVAIGECGLDYDRTEFCPKEVQLKNFEHHFRLAEATKLPLFLHDRNTGSDLAEILSANRHRFSTGVVHSFTGTVEQMKAYLDLDLYIGINGCSLKTDENLAVAAEIPTDRLMIETDAPWCGIRATHASSKHVTTQFQQVKDPKKWKGGFSVKGRCEPCHLMQVLEVLASIRKQDIAELASAVYENSRKVFFPDCTDRKSVV